MGGALALHPFSLQLLEMIPLLYSPAGGSSSAHMGGSGSGVKEGELLNSPRLVWGCGASTSLCSLLFHLFSFVFLQLYHSSVFSEEWGGGAPPVLLGDGEATERAIKVLDHIPPYDTHKIGVIYTARGQVCCVCCVVVCVCVVCS